VNLNNTLPVRGKKVKGREAKKTKTPLNLSCPIFKITILIFFVIIFNKNI